MWCKFADEGQRWNTCSSCLNGAKTKFSKGRDDLKMLYFKGRTLVFANYKKNSDIGLMLNVKKLTMLFLHIQCVSITARGCRGVMSYLFEQNWNS